MKKHLRWNVTRLIEALRFLIGILVNKKHRCGKKVSLQAGSASTTPAQPGIAIFSFKNCKWQHRAALRVAIARLSWYLQLTCLPFGQRLCPSAS
ncbi:MAG: hypothetical protein ABI402_05850 [Ferruginibacter sp.]